MEKFSVCAGSDFVNYRGLQIKHDSSGYKLARGGLTEEGSSRIISGKILRIVLEAIG